MRICPAAVVDRSGFDLARRRTDRVVRTDTASAPPMWTATPQVAVFGLTQPGDVANCRIRTALDADVGRDPGRHRDRRGAA